MLTLVAECVPLMMSLVTECVPLTLSSVVGCVPLKLSSITECVLLVCSWTLVTRCSWSPNVYLFCVLGHTVCTSLVFLITEDYDRVCLEWISFLRGQYVFLNSVPVCRPEVLSLIHI